VTSWVITLKLTSVQGRTRSLIDQSLQLIRGQNVLGKSSKKYISKKIYFRSWLAFLRLV
jgi:hypothetical protein